MDIEQMKKYFKNKIDSEKLTKKVRDVIKTTDWQKQDMREGFKESFNPLIESQESIKKSIDEQQNATIEQLKKNQLALTDKENMLEQLTSGLLAIMGGKDDEGADGGEGTSGGDKDVEGTSGDKDVEGTSGEDPKKKPKTINISPNDFNENLINKETQDILTEKFRIHNLPSDYFYDKDNVRLSSRINKVIDLLNEFKIKHIPYSADFKIGQAGYEIAEPRNKNPKKQTLLYIKYFNTLSIYLNQLNKLYAFKKKTIGKGINNYKTPSQLIDRLELLGGSIIAGNNGVIQEFSEIAHLLAQMKVITKRQLNELLKTYITNR